MADNDFKDMRRKALSIATSARVLSGEIRNQYASLHLEEAALAARTFLIQLEYARLALELEERLRDRSDT